MKRMVVIGGGISGLTVLHYLKQRLGTGADITLYEREAQVGGCIRTETKENCMFEWGPAAFLDSQPATLSWIKELGLSTELIHADLGSRRRYIQVNRQLHLVPMGFLSFVNTPLISIKDKWSLINGLLFKKNISMDCSIYDYITQRFSKGIAETLIDPMMSGIYAGDIKRLHMACSFPKFRKGATMCSFKGGMGQIIEELYRRYQGSIQTNKEIALRQLNADIKVIATPAYAAADILKEINGPLAKLLDEIPYAPLVVVGLCFKKQDFKRKPDGFGYVIPSTEHKDILGVLIESNIFPNRAEPDCIMLRVMMGGRCHRELTYKDPDQLIRMATEEIKGIYGLTSLAFKSFIKIWPKAIPQYEMNYPRLRQFIAQECAKTKDLYLCANYLGGISFNDCINNARSLSYNIPL